MLPRLTNTNCGLSRTILQSFSLTLSPNLHPLPPVSPYWPLFHPQFPPKVKQYFNKNLINVCASVTQSMSLHNSAFHFLIYQDKKRMQRPDSKCTAVHQGLSKYLTAQDTHISPTSTNHSRNLSSHGNLLSNHSLQYKTIKLFLFLELSKLIQKNSYSSELEQQNFQFFLS